MPISRRASFPAAAAASDARGWPVHVRRSGGTTVFHGDETLCVTMLSSSPRSDFAIDAAYRDFAGLLVGACAEIGVLAAVGSAPMAPCDGRFNLLVEGRKLAGTAMRIRQVRDQIHWLAHAAIFLDVPANGLRAIEQFERELGGGARYPPEASIGLSEIPPPCCRTSALTKAIVRRLAHNQSPLAKS